MSRSEPVDKTYEEEDDTELDEKMRRNPHLFAAERVPKRMIAYDWANGYVSPFVSSGQETVQRILSAANVSASDVLYDLGCGEGEFLIAAAKLRGCQGVGVDLDEDLIEQAREFARAEGVATMVDFRCCDLRQVCFDSASVVIVFLLPAALAVISQHLVNYIQSHPEGLLVSVMWELTACNDWELRRYPGDEACGARPFFVYGLNRKPI
mmetsp:Transcript_31100/g.58541  ORF Transcript_31100/g.58541 Transcript_31100/m.58541 type:complete len:209 (+) Transcript_31100:65-691(+)|eukprot:CAMPEP_0114314150 /NCGR_PEP_ID=MMETSP0059-20121206/21607_1 /TAXON_ID=36894 /ORGANISM="Pyramimonas parkeae, Strain CCMP726" /LENGTH=208 /DNA_ID=CAMNT_0001439177 /DNA_START=59 /DNA_END=685 /DNA_ORIENTATION=+